MFKEKINPNTTVKVLQACSPEVLISSLALNKMNVYIDESNQEIGWLGTVIKENNYFLIKDVFLFDQEVNSTTTEISPEGLSEFGEKLLMEENGIEIWNEIKVWGHSHVNMSVTPSAQDNDQMEAFAKCGHDWFIRIIANKKEELKVDLYNFNTGIIYLDLPWQEYMEERELDIRNKIDVLLEQLDHIREERKKELIEPIKAEIKEKVKPKTYTTNYVGNNYYKGYSSYGNHSSYNNKEWDIDDLFAFFDEKDIEKIANESNFNKAKILIQNSCIYTRYFDNSEYHEIWSLAKSIYSQEKTITIVK